MKKKIYFTFFLIFFFTIVGILVIWNIYHLINSNILIKEEKVFTLKYGTDCITLFKQLYTNKVIDRPHVLRWLLRINPELSNFKAGTYRFIPGMTIHNILQLLESGKEAQFQLRFVEGMHLSDYLKQLREAPWIKHTLKDDNYATVAEALHIKHQNWIEGWFWPDTWMYTAYTTDVDILKRAHKKMVTIVNKAWKERVNGLPYENKNQFVTMASIVEKETAMDDERSKITSVFINRLRIGMRLQTDTTVIYGMGKNYAGKISRKDLKILTPYNTYVISGLPPGPIAIPSWESLDAAAHPAKTPYLYFVADGKGRHTFNTNLNNHNLSVQKYLKVLKENA